MENSSRLAWLLAVLTLLCGEAVAGEPIAWESNLERAQQTAAQTNRLVLVHFWAPWCGQCKIMDNEIFVQPEVARQVQANYVPVKINADQYPDLAKKFGISGLPTDVILTPQGQVINVAKGKPVAAQYVARLNQWAANVRPQNAGVLASLPGDAPGANGNPPPMNPPLAATPSNPVIPNSVLPQPAVPNPAYGQSLSLNGPANTSNAPANGMPPETAQPNMTPNPIPANNSALSNNPQAGGNANIDNAVATLMRNSAAAPEMPPPTAPPLNVQPGIPPQNGQPMNMPPRNAVQPPSANPPMALDGYCPVTLTEKQQWIRGDKRWGAFHQGRTYLFTGPEEQRRFLANFDRYAPVISGDDIVVATEERKAVPGLREHGVFYANHIFLFANEATLQKFSSNPGYYAGQALGALRQAASAGQQPR